MNMIDYIQHRDAEGTELHRGNCLNCDFSVISVMNMMDTPSPVSNLKSAEALSPFGGAGGGQKIFAFPEKNVKHTHTHTHTHANAGASRARGKKAGAQ